jgi:hypothetical protein
MFTLNDTQRLLLSASSQRRSGTPLTIEQPFSIEVECEPSRFEVRTRPPMKEHVLGLFDRVRERLHQHYDLITIYNEKFDRELRTWAEAHGPMLDQIRSQLG